MTKRVFNFSAGPSALPLPVLEEAQRDLVCYPGAGMSVMEMSHRSKAYDAIIAGAEANVRRLLNLPDTYKVLFIQGGASLQFSMIPMNFLRGSGKTADYIVSGSWGQKAIKEAKREGEVGKAWDGKDGNFNRVPAQSELKLSADPAYVHFTSNETIQGVQFQTEPQTGAPLMCDASSDIFCQPIDISRYGMLYAGAQKNVGPAGVALVIVTEDLLARAPENLPSMLDYRVHAAEGSRYNTPPTFAIYIIQLVTKWLIEQIGGLEKMAEINKKKAKMLYDAIDQSGGFYRGHAEPNCRSIMNVTFRLPDENLDAEFLAAAKVRGLVEMKGHRSVGGCRASIYNAMPVEGVQALAEFMAEFRRTKS